LGTKRLKVLFKSNSGRSYQRGSYDTTDLIVSETLSSLARNGEEEETANISHSTVDANDANDATVIQEEDISKEEEEILVESDEEK
jgi:hypothetical protein